MTRSPLPDEKHHYRRNTGGGTSRHGLANKSVKNKSPESEIDGCEDKQSSDSKNVPNDDGVIPLKDTPNSAAESVESPKSEIKKHDDILVGDSNVKEEGGQRSTVQKEEEVKSNHHFKNARNNGSKVKSSNGINCDNTYSSNNKHACADSDKHTKLTTEDSEKDGKVKSSDSEGNERTNVSVVSASDVVLSGDDVLGDHDAFRKDALPPVAET